MVGCKHPVGHAADRRKMQIVRLVAAGVGNKEIARQLVISERTVEAHLDAHGLAQ